MRVRVYSDLKVLMSLIGAIACAASPVYADEKSAPPSITVSATGTTDVAPDMAVLSMSVVSEAKTARAALDKNNQSMAAVLKAMKADGVAAKDLQTSGFSISPRMSYPNRQAPDRTPKLIGYTVQNTVTARVRDLNKVGQLLDSAVTLGVNQGGSIRFTNDKPDAFISRARTAAMKKAIAKAQTLVGAAAVSLGRIIKISEHSRAAIPRPMARGRAMAMAESDAVPIEGGENTYSVNVTVTWEIAQ